MPSIPARGGLSSSSRRRFLTHMLSKGNGCGKAKIAQNMADKGFCSTKNAWYHGLKLHLLGRIIPHKMPQPAAMTLSAASQHDEAVFSQQIAPLYPNIIVYADKAYDFSQQVRQFKQDYHIELVAIHKRQKGLPSHDAFWNYFNSMVSRTRQPI